MRLSTKTRYGVRAVFDIAFHHADEDGSCAQAKDIARREDIPLRYLEQIFQDLKRAGLVESKRGPRGGYLLKRAPSEITLADVVAALQGPIEDMFVVEVANPDEHGSESAKRLTCGLWQDLADHVTGWFEALTFADLIERAEKLGVQRASSGQLMYYI